VLHVLVAPYLQHRARISISGWELIPRSLLAADDVVQGATALVQVRGLLELYHPAPRGRNAVGCVFRPPRRRVGEAFPRSQMRPLRRAIVAALLDGNPTLDATSDDPNIGHQVATSDNAALYGHGIDHEGYVAVEYGAMVTNLTGGLRIRLDGEDDDAPAPPGERPRIGIYPPNELTLPLMGPQPDEVYADALYRCLTPRTDAARRLGSAIDWLDLAWRNTPSTSFETRVVLLKSGFEVLLDAGDDWRRQRAALSTLLPDIAPRRRDRTWTHNGRARGPERMSDLEWWFANFTWLRNAIAHGDEVTRGDHRWGRTHHVWVGESRLRTAIKRTVANAGYPDVLLDPFDRAVRRFVAARGLS
jgi:hypothetical protein